MSDDYGRYKKVYVSIWNDDKFPLLSDEAKLVYFHVLTTPMSNQFGCFKAGICALSEESRMGMKGYRKGFTELSRKGFVKHDERVMVTKLKSFLKYNEPANPNVLTSWGKTFKEVPDCQLKTDTYNEISALCQTKNKAFNEAFLKAFPKPFRKPFPEPSLKGLRNLSRNQEQEQEQFTEPSHGEEFYNTDPTIPYTEPEETTGSGEVIPF